VNVDVKVSQGGKWYAEKDNWKPDTKRERPTPAPSRGGGGGGDEPFPDGDIPFATNRGVW